MKKYKINAFTLVELIVVIVILAILATIAFLSFSSQSASARDSTRLSDLGNISKGLVLFNVLSGKYPIPENYISINASGSNMGYQGYAGANVLNMVKISNGGKDPLDENYYTYNVNLTQNKFELLGFLEDGSNSALSLIPDIVNANGLNDLFADPSSYSGRYIISKGDSIGIILASGSLLPIQANDQIPSKILDIYNTNNAYTIYFNKQITPISGTGRVIGGLEYLYSEKSTYKWTTCNAADEIQINNQCWKKYNENTGTFTGTWATGDTSFLNGYKWCYNFDVINHCTNNGTGALYSWYMAINGQHSSHLAPSGVQGICPIGFHMPSDGEFVNLEKNLGCKDYLNTGEICVGLGYNSSLSTAGYGELLDLSGFGGGRQLPDGTAGTGSYTRIWTTTENFNNKSQVKRRLLYSYFDDVINTYLSKEYGSSVRCIKD